MQVGISSLSLTKRGGRGGVGGERESLTILLNAYWSRGNFWMTNIITATFITKVHMRSKAMGPRKKLVIRGPNEPRGLEILLPPALGTPVFSLRATYSVFKSLLVREENLLNSFKPTQVAMTTTTTTTTPLLGFSVLSSSSMVVRCLHGT